MSSGAQRMWSGCFLKGAQECCSVMLLRCPLMKQHAEGSREVSAALCCFQVSERNKTNEYSVSAADWSRK